MAPGILHDPNLNYTYPIETSKTTDKLSSQVEEWPTNLAVSLSWDGEAYAQSERYTYHLTDNDIAEIDRALDHFGGKLSNDPTLQILTTSLDLGLDGSQVNRANFPLATLGSNLSELAREVHRGRGFVNIRGLCPGDHSSEDNVILFLGLSSYIGEKRGRQNEDGEMLSEHSSCKDCNTSLTDSLKHTFVMPRSLVRPRATVQHGTPSALQYALPLRFHCGD